MVPKDDECEWLLRWLQLIIYQLAIVPNDNECRWLHLWHRYSHCTNLLWFWHVVFKHDVECRWLHLWHRHGHCTNLMWFCMVCSVDDCIVDYNWSNISLQWHRMVISVNGCICGINIAIAPTCCESKDAMCEWSAHWHQVGHCIDCVIIEIAYWHYLNQCINTGILTSFQWNKTYPGARIHVPLVDDIMTHSLFWMIKVGCIFYWSWSHMYIYSAW